MTFTGATEQATEHFFKAHKKSFHADKKRFLQDLQVSSVAVGTYLGPYDDATDLAYEEAVKTALTQGVNLIDTAINYRCQRSERAIGRALKSLIDKKKITRAQVVVATKGGFIPFDGEPTTNIRAFIQKNYLDTGIMTESDIVSSCHSLHPAYLQDQLNRSLANLGLDALDVYYLHNPETQLPVIGAQAFYDRLRKAFEKLEENVAAGKLRYYGMATWTAFREHPTSTEAVSIERVLQAARDAGGQDHHFRVIQLPYNLAMLEGVGVLSQTFEGKNYPIISAAAFHGVSVMISAPLLQGQLSSLPASLAHKIPGNLTAAQKALQFVTSTPSVTSAMVGMKTVAHVEENLKVLALPNWDLKVLQDICNWILKK